MPTPITKKGHEALTAELSRLKKVERAKVIEAIAEARSHGDLSENAEYDAAKERQGFVESRIKELENKLADARIIETAGRTSDTVVFGATVLLMELDAKQKKQYKLVGQDEADLKDGKNLSPIAGRQGSDRQACRRSGPRHHSGQSRQI